MNYGMKQDRGKQPCKHGETPVCSAVIVLLAAGLAPGCRHTPAPAFVPLPVSAPRHFSADGKARVPDAWWTAFGDAGLDAVERRVLAGNLSLRAAWERLAQARAMAREAGAARWPAVTLTSEASRSRGRARFETAFGKTTESVRSSQIALSAMAAYEADLWGRVRAGIDAAKFDLRATREDVDAMALSLSAETARNWLALAAATEETAIIREQLRTDRRYEELVRLRRRQGQAGASEVLQQEQHTEMARGDLARIEARRKLLIHALAYLTAAASSGEEAATPERLPTLPPLPKTGVPVDLIQRRPDVRAARLRVAAADQRVAAAVADRFPRLTLSLQGQTSAAAVPDLFSTWLASLAAGLTAPVFDAGRRRAEVERTRAMATERLHRYGDVFLRALREVEDALEQERRQRQYVTSLEKQLDLAGRVLERIRDRYTHGQANYLRVLDALRSFHSLQRACVRARGDLLANRVALYRALAGGVEDSTATGVRKP